MSDTPNDMQALAKRYMDMWQKQVSDMASDPALADAMAKSMALMAQGAKAAGMGTTAGTEGETADDASGPAAGSGTEASGTPADGPAPQSSGTELADLAARLDRLEGRMAAIEAALLGKTGKS